VVEVDSTSSIKGIAAPHQQHLTNTTPPPHHQGKQGGQIEQGLEDEVLVVEEKAA
jgi:hypothetical protein